MIAAELEAVAAAVEAVVDVLVVVVMVLMARRTLLFLTFCADRHLMRAMSF